LVVFAVSLYSSLDWVVFGPLVCVVIAFREGTPLFEGSMANYIECCSTRKVAIKGIVPKGIALPNTKHPLTLLRFAHEGDATRIALYTTEFSRNALDVQDKNGVTAIQVLRLVPASHYLLNEKKKS